MKLISIKNSGEIVTAIQTEKGYTLMTDVNKVSNRKWENTLLGILQKGQLDEIVQWFNQDGYKMLRKKQSFQSELENNHNAPLLHNPGKVWGIGFNYAKGQAEKDELETDWEPVCFLKPTTSIIGSNETIVIPSESDRTTAEGELAIIIGKKCKHISKEDYKDVVAGYTTALDMTAADIHERNPRFLARAKSFDTFVSIGSTLITVDELEQIEKLNVSTVLNGKVVYENSIHNMIYSPAKIVAFFSSISTLYPGDIILTGTPGPVDIHEGDEVMCTIDGFYPLINHVKKHI
ncbi:fumarylacetoacetate hydrolase family protein [Evansella sp. AB-P1]|uniref:fumarylacetoacetate hydrolase family protein n=1 Tax=Evansella sp. AB-P1 TaxID=3037653 RepID=UPI00241DF5D3|nr:fumarylacetoacetate hydrolase family protein [Evansella sp. AB-P1]MDG5787900.1 fumarylacetoacetate hydrolase family protein [Evansella sp. AB-P1]